MDNEAGILQELRTMAVAIGKVDTRLEGVEETTKGLQEDLKTLTVNEHRLASVEKRLDANDKLKYRMLFAVMASGGAGAGALRFIQALVGG